MNLFSLGKAEQLRARGLLLCPPHGKYAGGVTFRVADLILVTLIKVGTLRSCRRHELIAHLVEARMAVGLGERLEP
jgi:hypothetical protein